MLFSLTCTASDAAPDATVLGYLLHKHPDRFFEKALSFGTAQVYYPESTAERTTAVLTVQMDPVALVRSGGKQSVPTLAQYVSDRPYAPSSFLSVAIAEAFGTALGGRCEKMPEATETLLSLSATIPALSCDSGEKAIRRVFEPLGYTVTVEADPILLDDRFPTWGNADQFTVTLSGSVRLKDLLAHLYVLVPVLDNAKHYFVSEDEVEKLLRRGEGWLQTHPAKQWITARYLRYRRTLTDAALLRLVEVAEETPESVATTEAEAAEPTVATEVKSRLNDRRVEAALNTIRSAPTPPRRVIDLGCGEGKTLAAVRQAFPGLALLAGMDVAPVVLERAARRLRLDQLEGDARDRIHLFQGSLVYRDDRLRGYDVALVMEVIEHLDEDRLPALEEAVFAHARPRRVLVTTPNAEYNAVWESLPGGAFRHTDHRFEWTRPQFQAWANRLAEAHGYTVAFSGIGDNHEQLGTPTQAATLDIK